MISNNGCRETAPSMAEKEVPMLKSLSDPVHAPAHYAGDGKVECKAAMASMMAGYDLADVRPNAAYWCGCAFKYLWRWPLKNRREDLMKARECIDLAISSVGKEMEE